MFSENPARADGLKCIIFKSVFMDVNIKVPEIKVNVFMGLDFLKRMWSLNLHHEDVGSRLFAFALQNNVVICLSNWVRVF
jgi:hypothetical protein